jgi:hypothetical protein
LEQAYFGREKPIFGCRPILGKKSLFLEHAPYVEEKKHAEDEGKEACERWRKRSVAHMQTNLAMLGLGFFDMNVMAISQ